MDSPHANAAYAKLIAVWTTLWAGLSGWPLANWALLAAMVFSVLQSAKLIRDWRLDHAKRKAEKAAKELE
jgi:hypothetical protein